VRSHASQLGLLYICAVVLITQLFPYSSHFSKEIKQFVPIIVIDIGQDLLKSFQNVPGSRDPGFWSTVYKEKNENQLVKADNSTADDHQTHSEASKANSNHNCNCNTNKKRRIQLWF